LSFERFVACEFAKNPEIPKSRNRKSMKIHPTAVIHPSAEIADDAEIGPYVCIEGKAAVGAGCVIQAHAILTGTVRMGKNNVIGYGAVIGGAPQDFAFHPDRHSEVVIGDNNRIREHCTIHRGTTEGSATQVGSNNFFMAGVHLGHNAKVGDNVIIANNSMLGGWVEIQDRAFIGGNCVFHQFIRVGELAITQGASAFSKDIPPFTLAAERNTVAGLNVVGMRRAGFNPEQRREIKDAFKLLYKSGLNIAQALERARQQTWGPQARAFFDFVAAAKKRGICTLLESKRGVAEESGE
jgi:UDP-N-acetylglucosamine acyltransferase